MTWDPRPRTNGAGALAVWRHGEGPPLILIHGVGLRAEAWAAMVPLLAPHFALHAVDMPGHGASPLSEATELQDYVTRVATYLLSLDQPAFVAGHSMGAMIALELAAQAPEKIAGVAALNAIYRRTPEAAAAVQARADALNATEPTNPTQTLMRWFGETPAGKTAACANACRHWLTSVDPFGYKSAYRVFAHSDGPDDTQLRALKCPTLFMTGAHDPNSTPAMSEEMAVQVPNGEARTLPDAAHMMPMTHPEPVARALIETFLSSNSGDT